MYSFMSIFLVHIAKVFYIMFDLWMLKKAIKIIVKFIKGWC